jgi:hypothetical protein
LKGDPARDLTLYAAGCAVMNVVAVLTPVLLLAALDRRLAPRPWRADRAAVREILGTFSWNSAVVLAISSHERVCTVIGNLAFPPAAALHWNAVFGLAVRAVGYIRMAAVGMTYGLDAVSARLTAGDDPASRMLRLTRHATRLHALVALPAGLTVALLAEPLLTLWIARAADDPAVTIPRAVLMIRIMVFALVARAISDGWVTILYGAGQIRRVAPLVIAGGLLTPVTAITLLLALTGQARDNAPAIALTASLVLVHLVALPPLAARALGVRTSDLLRPIARPALATALASPVYLAAGAVLARWTLGHLFLVLAAFGAAYAALTWLIVLDGQDRRRVLDLLRRAGERPPAYRPPREPELEETASSISTGL